MLNGIPRILSPEMMRILMEMGHGDELVLADANFPARSIANECASGEVVYCEGIGVPELLEAILKLMPLDYAVESPAVGMAVPPNVDAPPVHSQYRTILEKYGYGEEKLTFVPRFDFYDKAKRGYAVFATCETARFANLILKKGVVTDPV